MFSVIEVQGTILDSSGRSDRQRRSLELQIAALGRAWMGIMKVQSNGGEFFGKREFREFRESKFVPQFRLWDGQNDVELSRSYEARISEEGELLEVDFGAIRPGGEDGVIRTDRRTDDDLKKRLKDAEDENDKLKRALDDREKEVADLEEKLRNKDNSVDNVATEEITRLKTQLVTAQVELATVQAQKAASDGLLLAAQAERDAAQSELDEIRSSDTATPLITDIAGSVARSLGDASKSAAGPSAFAVADAQVTLKGYLADGGQRFKPLDAAEISRTQANNASEISFRLKPQSDKVASGQTMPDVVGLTPASARRALRPLGNQIQVIEVAGKPAGGIVSQKPAAGKDLARTDIIRISVATGLPEGS